jgi:hypothetical protein
LREREEKARLAAAAATERTRAQEEAERAARAREGAERDAVATERDQLRAEQAAGAAERKRAQAEERAAALVRERTETAARVLEAERVRLAAAEEKLRVARERESRDEELRVLDRSQAEARAAIDRARGGMRELLLARLRTRARPLLGSAAFGLVVAALVVAAFVGLRTPPPPLSPVTDTNVAPRLKIDPHLDLGRPAPGAR